jgi:hypothetical protein
MSDNVLTRDNLHLSEPIKWPYFPFLQLTANLQLIAKKPRGRIGPSPMEALHSGDAASGASRQVRIVDVRCWSNSGKHEAIESISPFDPFARSGLTNLRLRRVGCNFSLAARPAYQRGVKKAASVQNTSRPRESSMSPRSSALFTRPDHLLPRVEDRDQPHTWTGRIRQPCRVCTRRRTT